MTIKTQNKGLEIREGRTELIVPHKDSRLTFVYNSLEKGNYIDVRNTFESQDLEMPDFSQTTSLVYSAFQNPDNKYSKKIINIMKNNWFWADNGILYAPKGVYIQDNPKLENKEVQMNESELINKLENNDSSVRFVRYGFKLEEQSSLELSKSSFVIGLVGEQGAEKLAEIADKHKRKSYLYGFNKVDKSVQRVAALGSDGRGRLVVHGSYGSLDYDSYAFGLLNKSAEGALQNIAR